MRKLVIVLLAVGLSGASAWAEVPASTGGVTVTVTPSGKTPAGTGGGVTVTPGNKAPADTGGITITPSKPAGPGLLEDQQRIADIRGYYAAGDFDKALEAAKAFLTAARDEAAKTEALRITADSLRRKGQWAAAATAYLRVRERYEKTSDDYIKVDAIAEVMKFSPSGVYAAPGAPPPKVEAGTQARTVADDAALNEALVRVAIARAKALKARLSAVQRARLPQDVMVTFKPVAEQARQLLILATDVPADGPHELGTIAGTKMAELGTQIIASLTAKYTRYQPKKLAPGSITTQDKKDVEATEAACKQMAEAEKAFQESLMCLGGLTQWAEGDNMRRGSADRRAAYEKFAADFVIPRSYYFGWYW
jgi:tetratricopeptide (TPR) repeat protein